MAALLLSLPGCALDARGTRQPERAEPRPEQPAEEPAGDIGEAPAEAPVDAPAEDPVEVPGEEPAEEPVDEPAEEPAALCDAADPSLIACFAFEGDPGDGSLHRFKPEQAKNLSYEPGKGGQALRVTRGSRLRFRHDAAWTAPAMTIDVWINPASLPKSGRYAVIDSGGKPSIFLMPSGEIRCTMGVERNVPYSIVPGAWTHIACLSDGQTQRLYVNGVEIDRSSSGAVLASGEQPIFIGSEEPSGGDEFDGLLDSLRIFGRTLAPEEICAAAGGNAC
ncbi:LamG-like jellyroll fold domain-containing protein [Sorangium sp. So ce834]|uniref:LamG domain-containing protein n=1 Tax=Sorangium sp. So ce834 TaxID=3133321 RepID=UPI003F5DC52E